MHHLRSPSLTVVSNTCGGHNTKGHYGRSFTAPSLVPKSGSTPIRTVRSSSLERKNAAGEIVAVRPRDITPQSAVPHGIPYCTGTARHSQENEISYTSLNYEEDDQPVNYSLKYTEEVASVNVAAHWTPSRPPNPNKADENLIQGSDPAQNRKKINPIHDNNQVMLRDNPRWENCNAINIL